MLSAVQKCTGELSAREGNLPWASLQFRESKDLPNQISNRFLAWCSEFYFGCGPKNDDDE